MGEAIAKNAAGAAGIAAAVDTATAAVTADAATAATAASTATAAGALSAVNGISAVSAQELTKTFGTRNALKDVSFELPAGAFMSVFGPNGAGKTTLLRVLSTLERPTEGKLFIYGRDAREKPDEARACIGAVAHEAMLYPDLTAEENLVFFGELYGVRNPRARALELLTLVGLKHRRLDRVRTFSRGMMQRVSIARALVNDPPLVLLDEPYSGLDPHAIAVFDELIDSCREGRADRSFVMVSHDLEKGFDMCTHLLLLAKGEVVAFGPRSQYDEREFSDLYRTTVGKGVS